jgi:hypothetical protein
MPDLLMPSEVKSDPGDLSAGGKDSASPPLAEPPSMKMVVRLFLIPLLIVGLAVGVMVFIGALSGSDQSLAQRLDDLKKTGGGGRTGGVLVGPGAKERYLDAQAIAQMMKEGMTEPQRIELSGQLIDILENHTEADEGEVRYFLLFALGRVWEIDPSQPAMDSPEALASRQKAMATLIQFLQPGDQDSLQSRKAAALAMAFWSGRQEARAAIPVLIARLRDDHEDLDVRLACATSLGKLGTPADADVLDALRWAWKDTKPEDSELVWSAALSLAELNQRDVADTILMILDRKSLADFRYFDREADPLNPTFRSLNDLEMQRYLINTMIGVRNYPDDRVKARIAELAKTDPDQRVRWQAQEIINGKGQIGPTQ